MRTLKKTLCVVLALVMMVGLCVIGTSAEEFTDADKITHKEAVDVLTGIGVINGMGDGTFNPAGTLTRAQAAKIVTYLLGYEDIKGTATFTDIPASMKDWAEGPIALCATLGIVNGVGDNKFDPEGTLTGSAWGKMVLCALGYNAEFEGMTGDSWEVGVAKTLKNTGLLTGVTGFDGTKNITRDEACQIAFNALSEPTRKFVEGMKVSGANINVTSTGAYDGTYAGKSLGQTVFGLSNPNPGVQNAAAAKVAPFYGQVISTPDTVAGQKYSVIQNVAPAGARKIAVALDGDMIGKMVKVFYKYATTEPADGYEVYAWEDMTTGEVTVVGNETTAKKAAAFKAAGITANPAGYLEVADGVTAALGTNGNTAVNLAAAALATEAGVYYVAPTTLTDATPKVWAVSLGNTLLIDYVAANGVVTTAGTERINLTSVGWLQNNETSDVVNEYEGIKAGDIVAYTLLGNVYNLYKATTVEGKVTAYTITNGKESITLDGKTYTKSAACAAGNALTVAPNVPAAIGPKAGINAMTVGQKYVLYLDQDGAFFAVTDADDTVDGGVVFVNYAYGLKSTDDYGNETVKYYLQCVDAEGKEIDYPIIYKTGANYAGSAFATFFNDNQGAAPVTPATCKNVQDGYKLTLNTKNAVTAVATGALSASATTGASAGATTIASTDKSNSGAYFTNNMKVVYVDDVGKDLATVVKTGIQTIGAPGKQIYYYATINAGSNYIQTMYILGTPDTVSSGTGIIYTPAAFNTNSAVAYTDKSTGATGTAYNQTVYIDGVKKTIPVSAAEVTAVNTARTTGIAANDPNPGDPAIAGYKFFQYAIDENTGLYQLSGRSLAYAKKEEGVRITAYAAGTAKGDLLSTNGAITDMLCADAVVVNCTTDANAATTLAGIWAAEQAGTAYTVDIVYKGTSASNYSVTFIYITNIV